MNSIKVWDVPVRLGHWLMAGGFIIAWLTADSEEWRLMHVYSGGMVLAVALFRVIWGIVGSRFARFTDFIHGPAAVFRYVKSLLQRQPLHFTGHNPAGGWAIMGLLALAIGIGISGYVAYQEWLGDAMAEWHEELAEAMLLLVVIHLAGVAVGSLMHGENLPRSMVTGRKKGQPEQSITQPGYVAAMLLMIWACWLSWLLAQ